MSLILVLYSNKILHFQFTPVYLAGLIYFSIPAFDFKLHTFGFNI